MKNLVKAKEEDNKKGKGGARSVRNAKTAKIPDKKGKPEKIATFKNKTKLEIKDKPTPHTTDKLNQTAKHGDKKIKFGKEKDSKEYKDKKEKEEKGEKQKLIGQKKKEKEKEKKMKEDKKKKEEEAKKRKEEKEKERFKRKKRYKKNK